MTVELSEDLWNATDLYTANDNLLDEGICEEFHEYFQRLFTREPEPDLSLSLIPM